MVEPSKYWHLVRVKSSGELRVDEISEAKDFFATKLSPLIEGNPTISNRDIQRRLSEKIDCADRTESSTARTCLRCYVSNELRLICAKYVKKFVPPKSGYDNHKDSRKAHKNFEIEQGLNIVDPLRYQNFCHLTEDILYPFVLDGISHPRKKLSQSSQQHPGLIDRILDTFDPNEGSLSTWTSRLFKQDKSVKQLLLEHGIELVTDWSLLNNTKPKKLRQILVDHTYSTQEIETLINLLETFKRIYQSQVLAYLPSGKTYPDPTPEQLIQISTQAETFESLTVEEVKNQLRDLAQIVRATRVHRLQSSKPSKSEYLEYSETNEFTELFGQQGSHCIKESVTKVVAVRIDSLSEGNKKKQQQAKDWKRIAKLFFCEHKSAVEIAQQFGVNQSTISRKLRLSKLQEDIGRNLLHCLSNCMFSKLELHLNPDQLKTWHTKVKAFLTPKIAELVQEANRKAQTSKNRCLNDPLSVAICQYITQQET